MVKAQREYFNQLAATWRAHPEDDEKIFLQLAEFGFDEGDIVLDLGCGAGRLTPLLRRLLAGPGKLISADFAKDMLRSARRQHQRAELVCTDAISLAFATASFDAIICFATFPHIRQPIQALREMHRILRPDGRLLIFHDCCSRRLNDLHAQVHPAVANDFLPRARDLENTLRAVDFQCLTVIENPDLYWVAARKTSLPQ